MIEQPDSYGVAQTHGALDEAIRGHVAHELADGEIAVTWIAVVATRRLDGGGSVIVSPSNGVMPPWEARGVLTSALRAIDAPGEEDE